MVWIGFDVGGTFTDLVAIDLESRVLHATKLPTSPRDPSDAALRGIRELLGMSGTPAGGVTRVVHGTTMATNALIEGTGARVGFLCDRGYRDVVEIGRMFREELYDINFAKTPPLVPRELRKEVPVRVAADGTELVPLDEQAARAAIRELVGAGVEAVAVGLLHSYAFPGAERRLGELIREDAPDVVVSLSHEVSAEYGEHERWTSAIVNAYLMPKMRAHLRNLERRIAELGIRAPLEIMQSNGGIVPVAVAADLPIRLLESGPAGGVAGIGHFAAGLAIHDLITFDMGGTSTDVCVLVDGEATITTERQIGGHSVRAVMADIHSIGAGGGSLGRVDVSGTLRVGPESAGSVPGPAALLQGSDRPTITDADIVLGYMNPERYCAGRIPLSVEAAQGALSTHVAGPTSTTVEQAALGMVNVAVQNMAGAIRMITTQRGLDPRDFALVASGGAGPVHAGLVARELRIPSVVVPAYPSLLSAQGMLFADYRADASRSLPRLLHDVEASELNEALRELEATCRTFLAESSGGDFRVERLVEMCYEGQQHGPTIPVREGTLSEADVKELGEALDKKFLDLYGFVPEHNVPRLVNLRAFVRKETPEGEQLRSLVVLEESRTSASALSSRRMFFAEHDEGVEAPVYDRAQLDVGQIVSGPAVIEEDFSTIVVYPGQEAGIDPAGNVIIKTGEGTV